MCFVSLPPHANMAALIIIETPGERACFAKTLIELEFASDFSNPPFCAIWGETGPRCAHF